MTTLLIAATRHAMLIVKSLALMIISASLSSTQVSAPSIPPFSTLVQMAVRTHPRLHETFFAVGTSSLFFGTWVKTRGLRVFNFFS